MAVKELTLDEWIKVVQQQARTLMGTSINHATGEDLDKLADLHGLKRIDAQPAKLQCDHKWIEYVGFSESYKYCEKCDRKQ